MPFETDPLMLETTVNLRRIRDTYADRIARIDDVLASMNAPVMSPTPVESRRQPAVERATVAHDAPPRKGRQMSAEARKKVSRRMKAYWKERRAAE